MNRAQIQPRAFPVLGEFRIHLVEPIILGVADTSG
jgi:hypothetical protein